jgi:hypothetical protein
MPSLPEREGRTAIIDLRILGQERIDRRLRAGRRVRHPLRTPAVRRLIKLMTFPGIEQEGLRAWKW